MNLEEKTKIAVKTHNIKLFTEVLLQLSKEGKNYFESYGYIAKHTNIDIDTYECFCSECDANLEYNLEGY